MYDIPCTVGMMNDKVIVKLSTGGLEQKYSQDPLSATLAVAAKHFIG